MTNHRPQPTDQRLVLVTPNPEFETFHDWLTSETGMDRVHPVTGKDDLLNHRLGRTGDCKRCFALVNGGGRIAAVIYTHWIKATATNIPWEMLPGKIDPILAAPSKPVSDAKLGTFHSITSFEGGSGRPLISAVHNTLAADKDAPILTTLSPFRTFGTWLKESNIQFEGTEEAKLNLVADYLRLKQDPVQKFHLGNGAQVGAIHLGAATKGPDLTEGQGVMISYRYPRKKERLAENLGILKDGKIPASYHLLDLLKEPRSTA